MAKKNTPIMTYKEILCRAHKQIELEVEDIKCKLAKVPTDMPDLIDSLNGEIEMLNKKMDAIESRYEDETGTGYGG